METPFRKIVLHLALVLLVSLLLFARTGQCSYVDKPDSVQQIDTSSNTGTVKLISDDDSDKFVAKRSLHHSYQSGLESDFAYSLPPSPEPHFVKQVLPAGPAFASFGAAPAFAQGPPSIFAQAPSHVFAQAPPAFAQVAPAFASFGASAVPAFAAPPVVKTLAFPAIQQRIVPGNAFVTSHSVNFPRYPVVQRPVVYAAPAAPLPPPAPIFAAPRPFVPAFHGPAFAPASAVFSTSSVVHSAPPPVAFPAPVAAPLPPPPAPTVVRPFVIVAKPQPPPPPPAPIFVPFAVAAAPVPCHHQSNMPGNNQVGSPSEPENFGFVPRPGSSSGGSGSGYLPPPRPHAPAHLTYKKKKSQPLRLSITSKYRPANW